MAWEVYAAKGMEEIDLPKTSNSFPNSSFLFPYFTLSSVVGVNDPVTSDIIPAARNAASTSLARASDIPDEGHVFCRVSCSGEAYATVAAASSRWVYRTAFIVAAGLDFTEWNGTKWEGYIYQSIPRNATSERRQDKYTILYNKLSQVKFPAIPYPTTRPSPPNTNTCRSNPPMLAQLLGSTLIISTLPPPPRPTLPHKISASAC